MNRFKELFHLREVKNIISKVVIEKNKKIDKGEIKMKKMKHLLKNEKGLTLIELLAVIVILAIVAAIAVPSIGNIIENSRIKAVKADAANILNAANLYFIDNNSGDKATFTNDPKTEGLDDYLESQGDFTEFTVTNSNPDTIAGTAKAGGKTITFTAATLEDINVDSADEVTGHVGIEDTP